MSPAQQQWFNEVLRCQENVNSQKPVIDSLAQQIFESLESNLGVLHVFGSGHSHIIAEEMFHRAGGLVPVNAILEPYLMPHTGPSRVSVLERTSGVAKGIFKAHSFKAGEFLIIASNSGINAVSIEMAELAKEHSLKTIAITSISHSRATPSRLDGKKLYELCDYVIDTGAPVGDACVEIDQLDVKLCPLSGIMSLYIAQFLVATIVECFQLNGKLAPVFQSANSPGGEQRNKSLEDKYRERIQHLI